MECKSVVVFTYELDVEVDGYNDRFIICVHRKAAGV